MAAGDIFFAFNDLSIDFVFIKMKQYGNEREIEWFVIKFTLE